MMDLIRVNYEKEIPTVSGRDLHEYLEVESNYTTWFDRMCAYGFSEGTDFIACFPNLESENHGGQNKTDHALSIDMAKELCMLARSEKGKQIRKYFIQIEKVWNDPQAVLARALKLAQAKLESLQSDASRLMADNSRLTVDVQVMRPKAEYFDELVARNPLTNFRDTAKELKIPETEFIQFLLDKKYIYRDQRGRLKPYADRSDLFELKECFNERTNWSGVQTLITPKGRETFMQLYIGAGERLLSSYAAIQ